MIFGPLTGASFNPARWFGPALVCDECGGVWPYVVGPLVGALLAVAFYRFVILAGEVDEVEVKDGTGKTRSRRAGRSRRPDSIRLRARSLGRR